jgi:hypothetical protein
MLESGKRVRSGKEKGQASFYREGAEDQQWQGHNGVRN